MGEEEQAIPVGNEALRRAAKKKKKGCRADARYFGWFVWKKFNSVSYKYVKVLSKIKVLKQYLLIWCFVSPSITIISFVRCQFSDLFSMETCFWKTLHADIFFKRQSQSKKILSLHHNHLYIYFITAQYSNYIAFEIRINHLHLDYIMPSSKNKFVGATNLYKELGIMMDIVELRGVSTNLIDASNLSHNYK